MFAVHMAFGRKAAVILTHEHDPAGSKQRGFVAEAFLWSGPNEPVRVVRTLVPRPDDLDEINKRVNNISDSVNFDSRYPPPGHIPIPGHHEIAGAALLGAMQVANDAAGDALFRTVGTDWRKFYAKETSDLIHLAVSYRSILRAIAKSSWSDDAKKAADLYLKITDGAEVREEQGPARE